MFYNSLSFNKSLIDWDVKNVMNMEFMFYNAELFDNNLNSWEINKKCKVTSILVIQLFQKNIIVIIDVLYQVIPLFIKRKKNYYNLLI